MRDLIDVIGSVLTGLFIGWFFFQWMESIYVRGVWDMERRQKELGERLGIR